MKNEILIFVFFPFLFFSQIKVKVIGISDGDTVTVLTESKKQIKVRLDEVDCPENGQPFGKAAKKFVSNEIYLKEVFLEIKDIDRYGRTIGKIYYDGNKYLSEVIVKAGYGWWYFRYSNNRNLGRLEEEARNKKLGLWQDKTPVEPWKWRRKNK